MPQIYRHRAARDERLRKPELIKHRECDDRAWPDAFAGQQTARETESPAYRHQAAAWDPRCCALCGEWLPESCRVRRYVQGPPHDSCGCPCGIWLPTWTGTVGGSALVLPPDTGRSPARRKRRVMSRPRRTGRRPLQLGRHAVADRVDPGENPTPQGHGKTIGLPPRLPSWQPAIQPCCSSTVPARPVLIAIFRAVWQTVTSSRRSRSRLAEATPVW